MNYPNEFTAFTYQIALKEIQTLKTYKAKDKYLKALYSNWKQHRNKYVLKLASYILHSLDNMTKRVPNFIIESYDSNMAYLFKEILDKCNDKQELIDFLEYAKDIYLKSSYINMKSLYKLNILMQDDKLPCKLYYSYTSINNKNYILDKIDIPYVSMIPEDISNTIYIVENYGGFFNRSTDKYYPSFNAYIDLYINLLINRIHLNPNITYTYYDNIIFYLEKQLGKSKQLNLNSLKSNLLAHYTNAVASINLLEK